MEKNYYDILEVNKNASPEIIEKAYKTLVKKYHPDLQSDSLKSEYEEKIKLINEAFETLSVPEKKSFYDLNLKSNEISVEDYNNLYNENLNLKKEINLLKNDNSNNNDENNNYHKNLNIVNQLIFDKTFINKISKNLLALFLTIFIFISIGFILWNIPYTKNYFINLYNTNSLLKFLVNLFIT